MKLKPGTTIPGLGALAFSVVAVAADDSHRDSRFTQLDSDGNGVISFNEFQQSEPRLLERMDSDADGELSLEEFLARRPGPLQRGKRELSEKQSERMREHREEIRERRETRRERSRAAASERFQEIDLDGSNSLSLTELEESIFLSLDRDGDGVLGVEELRRPDHGRRGRREIGRGNRSRGQSDAI